MNIDWNRAPEGATHWDPVDENWLRQFNEVALGWLSGKGWSRKGWQYPDDLSIMPRLIARPVWDGIGNPSAGVKCEIHVIGMPLHQWEERTVLFLGAYHLCYADSAGDEWCAPLSELQFRPIGTAKQIALAEERSKAIAQMVDDTNILTGIMSNRQIMASQLYDAGYRKVTP